MFNGVESLEYINIYNVEKNYSDIIKNNLKINNKLTVCQKDEIISGNTKKNFYGDYFDTDDTKTIEEDKNKNEI